MNDLCSYLLFFKHFTTKFNLNLGVLVVFFTPQSLLAANPDGKELLGQFRNRNRPQGGGQSILNRRKTNNLQNYK